MQSRATVSGGGRWEGAECSETKRGRRQTQVGIERDLDTHPGDCWLFPARHQAAGPSRWTMGGDADGPDMRSLTDSFVQFDEHEVAGVARVGTAGVGDGFDPLKQLLPGFIYG